MRRALVCSVVVGVLALGAVGCGGGSDPAPSGVSTTTVPTPVPTDNPISRTRSVTGQGSNQLSQLDQQTGRPDATGP